MPRDRAQARLSLVEPLDMKVTIMSHASRPLWPMLTLLAASAVGAQSVELVDGNVYWSPGAGGARVQLSALGRDREVTLSPDGRTIALVRGTPNELTESATGWVELTELRTIDVDGRSECLRLRGRVAPASEPALADFRNLRFAPDSSRIYFEGAAGMTQPAVHALELADGTVRFRLALGSLLEVLPDGPGPYAGHIIVAQHRYFVGGGSYDWAWLIAPDGREVGAVGDTDRLDPDYMRRREALRTLFSQSATVAAQPAVVTTAADSGCAALSADTRIEPIGRFSSGDGLGGPVGPRVAGSAHVPPLAQ